MYEAYNGRIAALKTCLLCKVYILSGCIKSVLLKAAFVVFGIFQRISNYWGFHINRGNQQNNKMLAKIFMKFLISQNELNKWLRSVDHWTGWHLDNFTVSH